MNTYAEMHKNTKGLHYAGPDKGGHRQIIIDAAETRPGFFEVMAMTRAGRELRTETTNSAEQAKEIYADLFRFFVEKEEQKEQQTAPLSGKYAKLRDDLKAAAEAGKAAAATVEDSGTCNFDSAALALPRWQKNKVEQAANEAGLGVFVWNFYGNKHFVFCLRGVGQANKRTAAADAMTKFLADLGYESSGYYQMD